MSKDEVLELLHNGWDGLGVPQATEVFDVPCRKLDTESLDAYDMFVDKKWDDVECEHVSVNVSWMRWIDGREDYYVGSLL